MTSEISIEDNFYAVELKKVSKSEIPPKIAGKNERDQEVKKSRFLYYFEMQIKNILERDDKFLTVLEKKKLAHKIQKG